MSRVGSRFAILLNVCLLLRVPLCGQAQPHPKSIPPIEPLLRSDEPRLIALGAWEVVKRPDDAQIPLLIDLAERWDPAQRLRHGNSDPFDAMTVVLDALIQRRATPSPAAVLAISHAFPDQALILASRLPPSDSEAILRRWYQEGRATRRALSEPDGPDRLLRARVAAMLLARDHPDEVAASILADSREQLAVSVIDPGSEGVDRCFFDCDPALQCLPEIADYAQTGWPPVFTYALEENDPYSERRNGILVYAGGDTITWRRVQAEVHQDNCFVPRPLSPVTRHRLLAEMLRVRLTSIPWGPQMNLPLRWTADESFARDLSKQVTAEEARLRSTVKAFFDKGLLTRTQLETIRPRLSVLLFDDRRPVFPARAALPVLAFHDPHTWCRRAPAVDVSSSR